LRGWLNRNRWKMEEWRPPRPGEKLTRTQNH
jgi:hypothetical protein